MNGGNCFGTETTQIFPDKCIRLWRYDLFSQKKSTEKVSSVVLICENREGGLDGYFHRSNLDHRHRSGKGSVRARSKGKSGGRVSGSDGFGPDPSLKARGPNNFSQPGLAWDRLFPARSTTRLSGASRQLVMMTIFCNNQWKQMWAKSFKKIIQSFI